MSMSQSPEPMTVYVTWREGNEVADGVRIANKLTLKRLSSMMQMGPMQSQMSFKVEDRGRRGGESQREIGRCGNTGFEEGAMS